MLLTEREQMECDVIANEILARVLLLTGYERGVLAADRSPGNVRARSQIVALMRSCVHPQCAQLSLRRIGRVCGMDVASVRKRIASIDPVAPWSFRESGVANG
jgi:hypothetical protein